MLRVGVGSGGGGMRGGVYGVWSDGFTGDGKVLQVGVEGLGISIVGSITLGSTVEYMSYMSSCVCSASE